MGLGLILGALITAVLLYGETKRRRALGQIRAYGQQREIAKGIIQRAAKQRRWGCIHLPFAWFIIAVGFGLIVWAVVLLSRAPGG
jgi:hypothetical protein